MKATQESVSIFFFRIVDFGTSWPPYFYLSLYTDYLYRTHLEIAAGVGPLDYFFVFLSVYCPSLAPNTLTLCQPFLPSLPLPPYLPLPISLSLSHSASDTLINSPSNPNAAV